MPTMLSRSSRVSPAEARRILNDMVVSSREEVDCRKAKSYNGVWLTVSTAPYGDSQPVFMWGNRDQVVEKRTALQVIETYGG